MRGIVKWYNYEKGFGFVKAEDDNGEKLDVFIHFSHCLDGHNVQLKEGDKVEFELVEGNIGSQAKNLYVVEDDIMKTFVIVGEHGRHSEYQKDILYAGAIQQEANQNAVKTWHDDVTKEVWVAGLMVEQYSMSANRKEWKKTFDLRENLEKEVEKSRVELQEKEAKLKEIQEAFGQ